MADLTTRLRARTKPRLQVKTSDTGPLINPDGPGAAAEIERLRKHGLKAVRVVTTLAKEPQP